MIGLAEKYYAARHNGEKLSNDRKMVTAQCLKNVSDFINEAYTAQGSIGVQHADLGMIKQFAMDVTNLVMPNLIADELVLVKPMEGMNTVLFY